MPILIFGIVALIGGFVTFLLPETKDLALPDTIDEVEADSRKHDKQSVGMSNNAFDQIQDIEQKTDF